MVHLVFKLITHFSNNYIYNGSNSTYGGVVYLNSGDLNISNSSLLNNGASNSGSTIKGGAIYMGGNTSYKLATQFLTGII